MTTNKSWICEGIPKNGKKYPNCAGPHPPYTNFGTDCAVCNLPRDAVDISGKAGKPTGLIAALAAAILLILLGAGWAVYQIIPRGDSRSEPPNAPSPISPGKIATIYPSIDDVPGVPQGVFSYGGSTTFAPLRSDEIVEQIARSHPGFQLRYTEPPTGKKPGSGTGIEMLLAGQLSFSQSSRPVKKEEFEEAETRNAPIEQIPVALDGIAFYVAPEIYEQVQQLTLEQIRAIYTGKIQNWQDVGGPDREIVPFSRNLQAGGTVDFFYETVLQKTDFGPNVKEVRDTTDSIRKVTSVANTQGGLGYATTSEVINQESIRVLSVAKESGQTAVSPCGDPNCETINTSAFANDSYPVTRRLFVVIKRDNRLDEQAGIAYVNMLLSDEGQELVERVGFVPLRQPD